MKKIVISLSLLACIGQGALLASVGSQIVLNDGWNLVAVPTATPIAKGDLTYTSISTFSGTSPISSRFINNIESGIGYWIQVSGSGSIPYTEQTTIQLPTMNVGWNLVGFPAYTDFSTFVSTIESQGYTYASISTFSGTSPISSRFITSIDKNKGYWINISSIDYDTFLQNAITADPDLTSYLNQNLSDKSIVVMENSSGALKTSLITFSSVTGNTYKEVELTNFSVSTLNGSDAEINATVSSMVSSLTTGICGNWNVDTTDLNMTPVDSSGDPQTTVYITDSSSGDFTVSDGLNGSIYKKVVYYGEAINLSKITNCQVESIPMFPNLPDMNEGQ